MKIRVACLQLNPVLGKIDRNVSRIRSIIKSTLDTDAQNPIDLLVLPELAVTGYNFKDRQHVEPFLEPAGKGVSFKLAQELSTSHNCFTIMGYPEVENSTIYNSALVVLPTGELVYNYRKTHLYETDEMWGCSENPDTPKFQAFDMTIVRDGISHPIKTSIGICMDLNPYQFTAPFNEFEMARRYYDQRVQLVVCPMAWLAPQSPLIDDSLTKSQQLERGKLFQPMFESSDVVYNDRSLPLGQKSDPEFIPAEPCTSTINYWILRFFPFLSHPHSFPKKYFEKMPIITCNRLGVEDSVLYGGSSSIYQFYGDRGDSEDLDHQNPSVDILGSLGQGQEGVLVRDVEVDDAKGSDQCGDIPSRLRQMLKFAS